jgi:hypothetical protein
MTFTTRGGRRAIISDGAEISDCTRYSTAHALHVARDALPQRTENALLKAIARAHRWQRMIESGEYTSITELAKAEKVNESYACRVLRLTLLSPAIVTDVLDGRCPPNLMLKTLMRPLPVRWDEQNSALRRENRIT